MTDLDYMHIALSEAQKAYQLQEVPVGAIIVDEQGQILSRAHNLKESQCCATAHAEILAIQRACLLKKSWRLLDCTLFVSLEPCVMCAGAIIQARIPRVVFATKDPKGGAGGSSFQLLINNGLNHQCQVESGLLEKESSQLLKQFFKERRY